MACRVGKSGSYATLAEALRALKRIQDTTDRDQVPQRVYACRFCRRWHMTSQPLRVKPRPRRR